MNKRTELNNHTYEEIASYVDVFHKGLLARKILSMDEAWRFHAGDVIGAQKPGFDDREWRLLDVPHD